MILRIVNSFLRSVIFAGFSSDALRDRVQDACCKVLVTCDQGKRGGKNVHLKKIADEAVEQCPSVENVVVYQRTGDASVVMKKGRDLWWHEEVANPESVLPTRTYGQ